MHAFHAQTGTVRAGLCASTGMLASMRLVLRFIKQQLQRDKAGTMQDLACSTGLDAKPLSVGCEPYGTQ